MKPVFFQTQAHIMICTGKQCAQRGSKLLFDAVWNAVEREKLAYYTSDGNLRLTESGCLGACQFGPTLACYFKQNQQLQEAWFANMDVPKTITLARALHARHDVPNDGRFNS